MIDDVNHIHVPYDFINPGSNLEAVMAVKGVLVVADHLRIIFSLCGTESCMYIDPFESAKQTINNQKERNAGPKQRIEIIFYSFHVGT